MQAVMDRHAGGITQGYRYSAASLAVAAERIGRLEQQSAGLVAADMQELVYILELQERLLVCRALLAHMAARKETRWHVFAEHADHPDKDPAFECYINSVLRDGRVQTFARELVRI